MFHSALIYIYIKEERAFRRQKIDGGNGKLSCMHLIIEKTRPFYATHESFFISMIGIVAGFVWRCTR